MARLGTPRGMNNSQPRGMNTLKQTFTPTSSTLTFAVWLFSWETRDADSLTLQFTKGPASAPVAAGTFTTFTVGENPGVTCTGSTLNGCLNSPITAGSSGFIGSHAWTYVTVNDLLPWVPVTFTASIGSGKNNSFASWLYLDNVNTPPVAKFSRLYPQTKIGGVASGPIEGSAVKLNDTSYDPDPGDKIVAWTWTVTGPGLPGVLVRERQEISESVWSNRSRGSRA